MKIISRGRARKKEADSRREFPGSRILADLWYEVKILKMQAVKTNCVIDIVHCSQFDNLL